MQINLIRVVGPDFISHPMTSLNRTLNEVRLIIRHRKLPDNKKKIIFARCVVCSADKIREIAQKFVLTEER